MIIVLLFIVRIIYFIELYEHLPVYKYVQHIPGEEVGVRSPLLCG